MIEIFKTNVEDPDEAAWLVKQLTKTFSNYEVNFDLDDCDRIMRVKTVEGLIEADNVIALLKTAGFEAMVLEDEIGQISRS